MHSYLIPSCNNLIWVVRLLCLLNLESHWLQYIFIPPCSYSRWKERLYFLVKLKSHFFSNNSLFPVLTVYKWKDYPDGCIYKHTSHSFMHILNMNSKTILLAKHRINLVTVIDNTIMLWIMCCVRACCQEAL